MILAIDPGTTESGFVEFDRGAVICSGVMQNDGILALIQDTDASRLAIETIASYGMAVGAEVFTTCIWIGRFAQRWHDLGRVRDSGAELIYRRDVKMHLCGSPRAKDANIRQALIDLIGPQGTKKEPGPTYGIKSHAWAALGVAATALNLQPKRLAA